MLTFPSDNQEKLSFLEALTKKVNNENSQDALVYASVAVAKVKLDMKDLDGARTDLDACERILDNFGSVETVVHAAFYDTNATYYQVRAAPRLCSNGWMTDCDRRTR